MPKQKDKKKRISQNIRQAIITLRKQNPTWKRSKIAATLNIDWDSWWKRKSVADKPRNQILLTPRCKRHLKATVKKTPSIKEAVKLFRLSKSKVYSEIRRSKSNTTGLYPYKLKKNTVCKKISTKTTKKLP